MRVSKVVSILSNGGRINGYTRGHSVNQLIGDCPIVSPGISTLQHTPPVLVHHQAERGHVYTTAARTVARPESTCSPVAGLGCAATAAIVAVRHYGEWPP